MAIQILEKRLRSVDTDNFERVKAALTAWHINPQQDWRRMPYLKDDLAPAITGRIMASPSFARILYNTINKAPLKRVFYGILSTGEIPEDFLSRLSNWERTYFFAGRWKIRKPNLTEPLSVLTVRHLKQGLDSLYEHHYVRKARGEYTRQLELPEDKQVNEAYKRIIGNYLGRFETPAPEPSKPVQGQLFETYPYTN